MTILPISGLLNDLKKSIVPSLPVAARRYCFKLLFCLLLISYGFCVKATAQEYNYRNYYVQHGLAGSAVYNMYQDKEGFIWFATETGVSRFDGTHFKKFTVKDGLPDNSIIRVFEDSRGRIWLVPFTNSICYYYKGKIYNQQDIPLLKRIVLDDYVSTIFENKKGEIIIQDPSHIYRIDRNDSLDQIPFAPGFPNRSLVKISESGSGDYFTLFTNKLFKTTTQTNTFLSDLSTSMASADQVIFTDKWWCWLEGPNRLHIRSDRYHLDYTYTTPPVNSLYSINDSIACLNTTKGTLLFNLLQGKVEKAYLPNKNISRFLMDKDGGLWFSTFNNGVYYLSSTLFRNFQYEVAKGQFLGVYDLEEGRGGVWAASDMGYLQWLRGDALQTRSLSRQFKHALRGTAYCIARKNNLMAIGVEDQIFLLNYFSPHKKVQGLNAIKDIAFKNEQELMVAGSNSLYSLRLDNYKFEKHWIGRATCLLYRN